MLAAILSASLVATLVVRADESSSDSQANAAPSAHSGGDPSINAAGSFSLGVPLELPPARGSDLPVPLSIGYNGSTELGHAGMGWEVQRSSIRRLDSHQYRSTTQERFELDLLGEHVALFRETEGSDQIFRALTGTRNLTAQRVAPASTGEYRGWVVRDDAGHQYGFLALFPPYDEYLLKTIEDSDGNTVLLGYDQAGQTPSVGLLQPMNQRADVALSSIEYSFQDQAGLLSRCPKYHIDLSYKNTSDLFERRPAYVVTAENGTPVVTRRLLDKVTVRSSTSCDASTPLRTYLFSYAMHAEIGLPVLQRVDQLGTGETDARAALPLVSYEYGSITGATQTLRYVNGGTIAAPSDLGGDGIFAFLAKKGLPGTQLLDLNGDGLADLLSRTGAGTSMKTYLYRGRAHTPGGLDMTFSDAPREELRTQDPAVVNPPAPAEQTGLMQIPVQGGVNPYTIRGYRYDTTVEYVDWDGDGRTDIIDTREQNYWRIYLNRRVPGGNTNDQILWFPIKIDVSAITSDMQENMSLSVFDLQDGSHLRCTSGCGEQCSTCEEQCLADRNNCRCQPSDMICQSQCGGTCGTICASCVGECSQQCNQIPPDVYVNVNREKYLPTSRRTRVTRSGTCKAYRRDGPLFKLQVVPCPEGEWVTEWRLQDVNGDSYPDLVRNSKPTMLAFDSCSVCPAETSDPSILANECRSGCTDGFVDDMHAADNRILVYYNTGAALQRDRAAWNVSAQVLYDGTTASERTLGPACGLERVRLTGTGYTYTPCTLADVTGDGLPDYITETNQSYFGQVSPAQQVQQVALRATGDPFQNGHVSFDRATAVLLPGRVDLQPSVQLLCPSSAIVTRTQKSGLVDMNRDGRVDYVYYGTADKGADGQPLSTATSNATNRLTSTNLVATVPGWNSGPTASAQVKAAAATTTPGWWIRFNNGVTFGPSVPIETPATPLYFNLQQTVMQCDGDDTRQWVTASLMDLDGDGVPEMVGRAGGAFSYQRIDDGASTGLTDIPRVTASGRLVAVRNAQLGTFHIGYGNAKAYIPTTDNVLASPEVVVAKTWRSFDKGLAQQAAAEVPTYFYYGDGHSDWDPLEERWSFSGYRRRIETRVDNGIVRGQLSYRTKDLDVQPFGYYVYRGVLNAEARFDARVSPVMSLLAASPDDLPKSTSLRGTDTRTLRTVEGNALEPYPGHTLPTRALMTYVASEQSWRGSAPPVDDSSPWVVRNGKEATADSCGRVTEIRNRGDLATTSDDVCTSTVYVKPCDNTTAPLMHEGWRARLDVPRSITVRTCDSNRTLSVTRFRYDGLGDGDVGHGHPTMLIVEAYDLESGAQVASYTSEARAYDAFGNMTSLARQAGASVPSPQIQTTTYSDFDPWSLQASTVTVGGIGLGTSLVTRTTFDPVTMMPTLVQEPNGALHRTSYDRFGRPTRSTIADAENGPEYLLATLDYLGEDPNDATEWSKGRRVRTRKLMRWRQTNDVLMPSDVSETTTFFDEIGRVRYTEQPLGADYGGATLVTGYIEWDSVGRASFSADPFLWSEAAGDRYGTTTRYFSDDAVRCEFRSPRNQVAEVGNPSAEVAPTCVERLYDQKHLVIRTRGPIENTPGSAAAGGYDETVSDGAGRTLSIARVAGGTRQSYAKLAYDAMGNLASIQRSLAPATGGSMQTWSFAYDSRGLMLRRTEPGLAPVTMEYDLLGKPTRTFWTTADGAVRQIRTLYDVLGRRTDRQSLRGTTVESHTTWSYDTASPDPRHGFAKNLLGQLAYTSSDGETAFYSYDRLGAVDQRAWGYGDDAATVSEQIEAGPGGRQETHSFAHPGGPPLGTEKAAYLYDTAGRLRQLDWISAAGSESIWIASQVSARGQVGREAYGNGAITTSTFGTTGRRLQRTESLAYITPPLLATTSLTEVTDYDLQGRKLGVRQSITNGATTYRQSLYGYDASNHLAREATSTNVGSIADTSFFYDALGNLTIARDTLHGQDTTFVMSTSSPDQLCNVTRGATAPALRAAAGCAFVYDEAGQLVSQATTPLEAAKTFTYDSMGRPLRITSGQRSAELTYGAAGVSSVSIVNASQSSRDDRRYGGQIERSLLGGQPVWEYRLEGSSETLAYVREAPSSQQIIYPHGDGRFHLELSGAGGALTQRTTFDAWGTPSTTISQPGDPGYVKYQWNGADTLEGLGVLQMGARLYDPAIARFVQRDPLIVPRKADQLNPYAYAHGDPINKSDATGEDPYSDCPPEFCGAVPVRANGSSGLRGQEMAAIQQMPAEIASIYYNNPVTQFAMGAIVGGLAAGSASVNMLLHPIQTAQQTFEMVGETYQSNGGGIAGVVAVGVAMSPLAPLAQAGEAIAAGDAFALGAVIGSSVVGAGLDMVTDGMGAGAVKAELGAVIKEAMPKFGARGYFPRTATGWPIELPQRVVNDIDLPMPDPLAGGYAHTTLGGCFSSKDGALYRQSATFHEGPSFPPPPDGLQVPFSRVDWHDHGRPKDHPNPHQHELFYDMTSKKWSRSDTISPYWGDF